MALAIVMLAAIGCQSNDSETSTPASAAGALLQSGEQMEMLDSLVEALRCYDSCVALAGRPGTDSAQVLPCLIARARLHLVLSLYSRALADAQSALNLQAKGNFTPMERGRIWLILAGSFQGQQQHLAQADTASDSALSRIAAGQPPDTALHIDALLLRGLILTSLHRAVEAEKLFSAAVALCSGPVPPERLWEAQSLLGLSMVKQSRLDEAEPLLLRSFVDMSGNLGNEDPLTRAAAGRVAEMYEAWGKPDLFAHYQLLASPPPPEEE